MAYLDAMWIRTVCEKMGPVHAAYAVNQRKLAGGPYHESLLLDLCVTLRVLGVGVSPCNCTVVLAAGWGLQPADVPDAPENHGLGLIGPQINC